MIGFLLKCCANLLVLLAIFIGTWLENMVLKTSSNLSSGCTGPPFMWFASKKWSTIGSLRGVEVALGCKTGEVT